MTTWQPRPGIAAVLRFVTVFIGMLYVAKPRLAAGYFIAAVAVAIVDYWLSEALYVSATLALMTVSAWHTRAIVISQTFLL